MFCRFVSKCEKHYNDLFTLMHQIGAKPVIKIRKNASTDRYREAKYRRKAIREY